MTSTSRQHNTTTTSDHETERARREKACYDALIAAGIADPGTRVRLAALPHITAAVVRAAAREGKASGAGPGAIVSMIETASARIALEQAARAAPQSPGVNDPVVPAPSTVADRTQQRLETERADAEAARREWAEAQAVLGRLKDAEIEFYKAAVLEANPTLRRVFAREDPRTHRMLGVLVAERVAPAGSEMRPAMREAVTA